MNTLEFLTSLRKADITLTVDGEELHISAPSEVITESLKAELKHRKKEIVNFLRRTNNTVEPDIPSLTPVSREQDISLAPAQERLWALAQLMPQNPSYNMYLAFTIKGSLQVPELRESLQKIMNRHEILRTTFTMVNGNPVQTISPEVIFNLFQVDLREFVEKTQASELKRLINLEIRAPFDLRNGPLIRAQLLKLNSQCHVFIVTMHHLVSDGWSFSVFFDELTTLYEASISHMEKWLPVLPIQYADFSFWHRRWLDCEDCRAHVEYWRKELGNDLTPLILPLDRPRSITPTMEGAVQTLELPSSILNESNALSQHSGISHNIIFLTAFIVVLFKYSGQQDLLVCSPVSGRDRDEFKSLIGFFNNIVPIRIILNEDISIFELLKMVRIRTFDAFEHQQVPLHRLVSEPQVSRIPLTRAMYDFQDEEALSFKLPGTTIEAMDFHNGTTNFELTLLVLKTRENYKCTLEYKTTLFEMGTIQRMLTHFQMVIENIVHDPEQKLSAIPFTVDKLQRETYLKFNEYKKASDLTDNMGPPAHQEAVYVPPQTQIEKTLAAIWCVILGVDRVGLYDNFFALGGHSLLATQVVSRIREQLKVEMKLAAFFEAPTIAGLVSALEVLPDVSTPPPALTPYPRDSHLPLSYAQQRLWFLHQLEPESTGYHSPFTVRINGPLDVMALQQSFQVLVDRHEILRTSFPTFEGQARQAIAAHLSIPWRQEDLRGLGVGEREQVAQGLVQEDVDRLFDLATGPLIRLLLVQLADEDFVLAVTLHHIISDGWSLGVLSAELHDCYEAITQGTSPRLAPLPVQYADFTIWQREWLQGEVLEQQLAYWRHQLAGITSLDLPTDYVRPAFQTHGADQKVLCLSAELRQALQTLGHRHGASLAITLLAGFAVLLAKYTGQTEVVVGLPIANRNRKEIEGLIGFFVNSLVMRTDVAGDPSFEELLKRVKAMSLEAYDHQEVPFEQIVEELQPDRDTSRNPLFQVMFAMQNAGYEGLQLPGLVVEPFEKLSLTTRVDLECHVWEQEEGLMISLLYNTDLFLPTTMERFIGHYQRILEEVIDNPHCRIHDLSLLPDSERHQLLWQWNATQREYPTERCIHELFEAQVTRTPDAIAVVFEKEQVTYSQLNSRANKLADRLQQQGVGRDIRVGLCVERSVQMLVGLLGILKTGAAYVPLDPTYPAGRLHFIIDDAQMPVIVTNRHLPELLHLDPGSDPSSSSTRPTFVDLDAVEWEKEGHISPNPRSTVTSQDLMYIIYTSGSTGTPKGVMIAHRTVGNFLHAMQEELTLTHQDTFLALTSISFDISVLEIFGPLLVGGCVNLISRDTAMDGPALVQALTQSEATLLQATPVTWQLLLDSNWAGSPGLRALCGGEALAGSLAQALLEKGVTLWNMYGPTETTVWSAMHRVTLADLKVPIGRPIGNTHLYVLDAEGHPVPVGVAGELYIGGEGLSRGYWRREELTAERFLPHPYSKEPGARVYRTGDRVRWRAEGELEYQGRQDGQIKLRGYRIELGEIEATLSQHGDVQEVVVMCREDSLGDKQLAAYVVGRHGKLNIPGLQAYLQKRLPGYMVPGVFVMLERLPLTPNGKVDRRRLPGPKGAHRIHGESYVAPRNEIERIIAHIWQEVLKIEQVGIHDNFFEVGGHSLLAMQVIGRLRSILELEIPLRTLFEQPTLEGLGQSIDNWLTTAFPDKFSE